MKTQNRRQFIQHAATTAAVATSLAPLRAAGANDRLRTALIGCGGRGSRFIDHVEYVCDPDPQRLAKAADAIGAASTEQAVTDFRRLLDNPDVDAVVVTTLTPTEAPVTKTRYCSVTSARVSMFSAVEYEQGKDASSVFVYELLIL